MSIGTILVIVLFVGMVAMHLRGHGSHGAGGGCCGGGHGGHGDEEQDSSPPKPAA